MVGITSWLAVQHRIQAVTNCVTEELTIGIMLYGAPFGWVDRGRSPVASLLIVTLFNDSTELGRSRINVQWHRQVNPTEALPTKERWIS